MRFTPYPYQQIAIDHAVEFLRGAAPGQKQGYTAPTGCGKSVIELAIQQQLEDTWIVTPREEIVDGMMDKLGAEGDPLDYRIATPVRLRNRLLDGRIAPPKRLIFDETHHHNAETWQQLDLLTGLAPAIGLSATFFRGSPKGTREMYEHWGEPIPIITFREAVDNGYISMPTFETLPLVDDDIVDVRGGDFDVTSLEGATVTRLGDLADHARKWYGATWDRPTIFACPSSEVCRQLQRELSSRGAPVAIVSAETPKDERRAVFKAVVERVVALAHINIVSEGVDLPLRRLVDLAPTLSPVKWTQQLGRITRPLHEGEAAPEYVCTNRNIMRHAYVLEGIVPTSALVKAEKAFPRTERGHGPRALGLEAIGRFKPTTVKLVNGLTAHLYALSVPINTLVVEYCCVVHPNMEPIWASKVNQFKDGVKTWGTWRQCEPPSDLRGFASVAPNPPSEKQLNWWKRSAASFGLDPSQEVTRKNFQALPVLADMGVRL